MIVIRTAEEMARALDSPLDPQVKSLLAAHLDRLSEYNGYELSDLALFIIAEPGDTLTDIAKACPVRLVTVGGGTADFAIPPELVHQHTAWIELTFILSDDGFGLALFVPKANDLRPCVQAALEACLQHLHYPES